MYFWVVYVLLLWVEVTLHFWEMVSQHLQSAVLQGIELFPSYTAVLITVGFVEMGGFGYCFSFALTSFFAILFPFERLRQGLGTLPFSRLVGVRILRSAIVSRFGV